MSKRVAVTTDAVSAGEFFPYWRRYYASEFGAQNLFVATYREPPENFAHLPLGRLIALDVDYSDDLRARLFQDIVRELLTRYDVVIHCDVDEFLAPHPRRAASLRDYVETLSAPYVTALGYDVIPADAEGELRLDGTPLLRQRRWAVATSSLCKTALTTRPLIWSPGFHFCNAPPRFDDLLLFHFKFADIARRADWFEAMKSRATPHSSEHAYYSDAFDKLSASLRVLAALPKHAGDDALGGQDFVARLGASVTLERAGGLFSFPFVVDDAAHEIPEQLRDAF